MHNHTHDEHCDHDHDHGHEHPHEHAHDASSRRASLLQAALIAITGGMLLVKVVSGTLPFYVHVRYTTLIAGTGIVLMLLGMMQVWFIFNPSNEHDHHDHEHDHGHTHEPLSWRSPAMLALMVPIVLGLLVPPKALTSAAIDTRGFGNTGTGVRTIENIASQSNQAQGISFDRSNWTLLNWVNGLIYEPNNPVLQGQEIEVVGFVWRSDELQENEFYLARFIVSCCTADSLAIYMPVRSEQASEFAVDSWIRVKGTVALADVLGEEVAVIDATDIIPTEQPAEPYLYP